MTALTQHLRRTGRLWRRSPAATVVLVLTMALAIGAVATVFSAMNAVLLRPLPYPHPEELVALFNTVKPDKPLARLLGTTRISFSYPAFQDLETHSQVLQQVAAYRTRRANFSSGVEPELVQQRFVSRSYFDVLGVGAWLGRTFRPSDFEWSDHLCVLSYGLWQRQFGGRRDALGRSVTIDDTVWTVAGVMPAGFSGIHSRDWGIKSHLIHSASAPDLWTPLAPGITPEMIRWSRGSRNCDLVARLKPGATLRQAQTEMDVTAQRFGQEYREDEDWGIEVVSLHEAQRGDYRVFLSILMTASLVLLFIAVINSGGLLLEQALARESEMAIRVALGASRRHVLRQLLIEGLSLSSLAAVFGVCLALAGCRTLNATLPGVIVGLPPVRIDWVVLSFTLLLTLVVGLAFGVAPAAALARTRPCESLKSGRCLSQPGKRRIRSGLVVAQISLTFVLLVGTGLLLKSLLTLSGVNPGCRTRNILTMQLNTPRKADSALRARLLHTILDRLSALPGIRAAALVGTVPVSGDTDTQAVRVNPAAEFVPAYSQPVSANYFTTLAIPLLSGRFFTERDDAKATAVAIINKTLADTLWKGVDPVGRPILYGAKALTVIGVVGDVRQDGLEKDYRSGIYLPYEQHEDTASVTLAVRTEGDPLAFADAIRRSIHSVAPAQPVSATRTMERVVANNLREPRLMFSLLAGVAGMAVLLALLGIYGLLSHSVRRSTRELALRVALGAQRGDVLRGVLRAGILLAAAGQVIGLLISIGVTRFLTSQLHFVSPTDGTTFLGVSVASFATAVVACAIPARRATRVDPATALREE